MTHLALAILLLVSTTSVGAVEAEGPVGGKPYDDQVTVGNERFLLELKARIEQSGYDDVRIIPRLFFVSARDKEGRNVCLVVDSNSLAALPLHVERTAGGQPCAPAP